jgi:FkbM family methyltransferase
MNAVTPKETIGRWLLAAAEAMPALRRWMLPVGLRTWKSWAEEDVHTVYLPDRTSFKVCGRNYLEFEIFWKGTGYYEPITTEILKALLVPGDAFVDVGANIGFYSLLLSTVKRGLSVTAFEPNPNNFALLSRNAQLNRYDNIRAEPVALSDRHEIAQLFLSDSAMSASLVADFEESHGRSVPVQTTTLDRYLESHRCAGHLVIKVDVEGHESAFFRGAEKTLATRKPDLVTEVTLPFDAESVARLRRCGYNFYPITDEGLKPADTLRPVVRDEFVFLNYLLSTKSPAEAAALFARAAPVVRALDLRATSKHLPPDALARFRVRAGLTS